MSYRIVFPHLLIIAVVCWLLVMMETPYGIATSPDSLSYLDIANNIRQGHGAVSTDLSLANSDGSRFVEQRLWPVLYPALLSVVIDSYTDAQAVASLSALLAAATAMLVYLLLARYMMMSLALVATLLFTVTQPFLTIFTYAWSEALFIPLLLLATLSSLVYADAGNRPQQTLWLGILCCSLLAVFHTRYAGAVFAIVLPVTFWQSRHDRFRCLSIAVVAGIYALAVAYALYNNWLITGHLSGGARGPSAVTFAENLARIPLVLSYLLAAPWWQYAGLALLVLILLATPEFAGGKLQAAIPMAKPWPALVFMAGLGVWYVVAMAVLRSVSQFDDIDLRLLTPAFPLLWVAMWLAVSLLVLKGKPYRVVAWALMMLLLLLPANGYRHLRNSMTSWHDQGTPAHSVGNGYNYNNYTQSEQQNGLRHIFAGIVTGQGVIVAPSPLGFSYMLGKRALQLPAQADQAQMAMINALPAGSVLVHIEGTDPFSRLRLTHDLQYSFAELPGLRVVRLPIQAMPKQ